MYGSVRRYRVRLGTVAQAARHVEQAFMPVMREVPGLVAYYLIDVGNSTLASIAAFRTPDGAAEASRLMTAWFRSDWPSFQLIAEDANVPDRRNGLDGRSMLERRYASDRRHAMISVESARRAVAETGREGASGDHRSSAGARRGGEDRRAGSDRRADAPDASPVWIPLPEQTAGELGPESDEPSGIVMRPAPLTPAQG